MSASQFFQTVDQALEPVRARLLDAPFDKIRDLWQIIEDTYGAAVKAWLGRNDHYYLLVRLLHRVDAIQHHAVLDAGHHAVAVELDLVDPSGLAKGGAEAVQLAAWGRE